MGEKAEEGLLFGLDVEVQVQQRWCLSLELAALVVYAPCVEAALTQGACEA